MLRRSPCRNDRPPQGSRRLDNILNTETLLHLLTNESMRVRQPIVGHYECGICGLYCKWGH